MPILDLGLVDISLRLNKLPADVFGPQFDIRSSIHDLHMRTCYDSGSALAQLIAQLTTQQLNAGVNAGRKKEFDKQTTTNSPKPNEESHAGGTIAKEHQERVSLLMADAVQETADNENHATKHLNNAIDLDHMNSSVDDTNVEEEDVLEEDYRILSPVKTDLGDLNIFLRKDYLQPSYLDANTADDDNDDDDDDVILDTDIEDDFVITDDNTVNIRPVLLTDNKVKFFF